MKKINTFIALLLLSGVIFAQTQKFGKNTLTAVKVAKEVNNSPANSKAIIDSLRYDGVNADGIGVGGAATFEAAAFFPAAQLAAHNAMGNTITAVKVYIVGVTNVTSTQIKIYSDQGVTLVKSQAFTPIEGWNNVVFTTAFPIPATDLYIGYECIATAGYPLGCDAGPVNPNGNWIKYNGAWSHLTDLAATLTFNWNIRAMVDGTAPTSPVASCTPLLWNAGSVITTNTATSGTFTLTNVGGGALTATSITGVSAPFTCTLVPASVNLAAGISTTFTFSYNPTVAGVNSQTAVITTNGGVVSIPLTGTGLVCNVNSSYPFTEGFEGANFPPDCWTSNDVDGDTYNWESRNITGWTAHSGTGIAVSASYQGVALTPDNYLVTPKLNINSPNLALKYWVAAQDPLWAGEHYSVMVSTTTNAPASFTEVFNETLTDSIFHEITVPLTAYNGQNIYIAFRHWNVTDMFYLKLDDVSIDLTTGISNNDLDKNISVYPNPARNIININSTEKISNVKVMNVVGSTIYNEAVNSNNFKLNSSNYNAGIYFIQLDTKNGTITKKIQILE
ncbi:MAG: T9SS type A sorting domain-containing protein [Bacteroidetes bacterium]|nr:T9SS type A sorting domain-containing protein [Bacteroidota bacterium]